MTEIRRQQINAASRRYYQRLALNRRAVGLTSRGTVRKYRRWMVPGMTRWDRARLSRDYSTLGAVMDEVAHFMAMSYEWLPDALAFKAKELGAKMARIKRFSPKRKVRVK